MPAERGRGGWRPSGASGWACRVVATSAATGAGLGALRDAIFERVPPEAPQRAGRRAAGHPPRLPPGRGRRVTGSRASAPAPSGSTAGGIERLIARHDMENDEALRYVEERLRALGRDQGARGRGLRAGRRRGDRRDRVRARSRRPVRLIQVPPWPAARSCSRSSSPAARSRACGGGNDEEDVQQAVRDFVKATNERDGGHALRASCSPRSTWRRPRARRATRPDEACKQQLELTQGLKLELISIGQDEGRRRRARPCAPRSTPAASERQPRLFQLEKEDGEWRLASGTGGWMATVVVKLGSSIVADDAGEVRTDVLGSVCDEVAARHEAGDELVLVTSGAIARGMRADGAADAPARRWRSCRPPRRSARASSTAPTTSCSRRAGCKRPGAAHVLRHVRAHALPERAAHAAQAARLARRAGDQRERHDHHRRDLVRRQRLPRRPGGDPDRRRPAGAAHRHRRPLHGRPAPRPRGASWSRRCATSSSSSATRSACRRSPLGSGGMRSKVVAAEMATAAGIPALIASGIEREAVARGAGRRAERHALPRPSAAACRASSCGSSTRSPRTGALAVDDGAERALRERGTSLLPVGVVEVEGELRGRRRGRGRAATAARSARGS